MKISFNDNKIWRLLALTLLILLPSISLAQEATPITEVDLKQHFIGYFALIVTVFAYIAAMTEDLHQMCKAKPMLLGSALIWFAIFIYYWAVYNTTEPVIPAFESNLTAYSELFLFITVSMAFLNAMTERGIFDALRIILINKQFSYRRLFWITGLIAFLMSTVISSLTVGLMMGYLILSIGKGQPKFIGLTALSAVVACNAGGTLSPLGGISTFFVWQQNMLQFTDFFKLTIPCIVNFLVPASIMYFSITKELPAPSKEKVVLKRGSKRIIFIFFLSVIITIVSDEILHMPTVAGMMFGLTMLLFVSYYLNKSENKFVKVTHFSTDHEYKSQIDSQKGFDVFKCIAGVDWDTLLFFYGAMMIVGALDFLGYLTAMEHYLLSELSPTLANIMIGLTSSIVDNGTLMFAVLKMNPHFAVGQWLLLTLTLGVGGSLLALGSAPGLHVLGLMKEHMKEGEGYTFTLHLRWMPAILLGYFASVATLYLINGGTF
jgi:Na+/H+ antiporter NhaD/arsenite permease-like protein